MATAVGRHRLNATHTKAAPMHLTTDGSAALAQIMEVRNLDPTGVIFAKPRGGSDWTQIHPKTSIKITIPASGVANATDLSLATDGEATRLFMSADTDKLAGDKGRLVEVSAHEIIAV